MRHTQNSFVAGMCILIVLAFATPAFGGIVTFSTMRGDITGPPLIPGHGLVTPAQDPAFTWNYTGNYADPRLPVYILAFNNNNQITICTNGACANPGNYGFGRTYTGYEFIYFGFQLPAGATNIALNFNPYAFDDRVVVDLNGHLLGAWGITSGSPSVPSVQWDGTGSHPATYTPQSVPQTVSTQSWFNPGGTNYVRFWLNNTGEWVWGDATPHGGYNDPSAMQAWGAITFDTPTTGIPAMTPAALAVLVILLGALAVYILRKPYGSAGSH